MNAINGISKKMERQDEIRFLVRQLHKTILEELSKPEYADLVGSTVVSALDELSEYFRADTVFSKRVSRDMSVF